MGALVVFSVGLIYVALTPPDAAAPVARRARPKPKTTDRNDPFTKEDYGAKFARLNEPVQNAFRPLVARQEPSRLIYSEGPDVLPGGIAAGGGDPSQIPAEFTDGDAGWRFTGYADVDGVRNGLLENRTTGDGVFVRPGERWKRATVRRITSTELVLAGPSGERTISINDGSEPTAAPSVVPPGGVAPVNPGPALRGQIGAAAATTPPSNELSIQPDQQQTREARRAARRAARQRNNEGNLP